MEPSSGYLLTVNTGSSSLKAALYRCGSSEELVLAAQADRIGLEAAHVQVRNANDELLLDRQQALANHSAALHQFLDWLRDVHPDWRPSAVGHRIVHGGLEYSSPVVIDAAVIASLHRLVPLAPDHLPQAIAIIEDLMQAAPSLTQVACFDTAFHRTLPIYARRFALPRELADEGVVRFGFHGLSYEYLVDELHRLDPKHGGGRAVLAHLGNGASMAAVLRGKSIDTSMGFTPAGGLIMGTRPGDLDPGVLIYLLEEKGLSPRELSRLVNRQAGLLGISGTSADMRDLIDRGASDSSAAEAVDMFCYQAKKFLGAYAAVLGGLDTVVFTGGIGEHAPSVREAICRGLEFLGVRLDRTRNLAGAAVISTDDSGVTARVIKADEDLMIARHTRRLLLTKGLIHA